MCFPRHNMMDYSPTEHSIWVLAWKGKGNSLWTELRQTYLISESSFNNSQAVKPKVSQRRYIINAIAQIQTSMIMILNYMPYLSIDFSSTPFLKTQLKMLYINI